MGKVRSSEKGDSLENSTGITDVVKNKPEQEVVEREMPNGGMMELLLQLQKEIEDLKKNNTREAEDSDEFDTLADYLEVPAVFFSFSSEYACHADVRNGKESRPPLGDFIKFKKLYRYNRKGAGRAVETIAVSQAIVRSKKTAEWIRKHTLFGIKFFENINDAKSVDVTLAEKMAEAAGRVSSMSDYQVIERARIENIYVHQDLEKLRKELIQKLAKNDIQKVKTKQALEISAERDDNSRKIVPSLLSGENKGSSEVY